MTLVQQDQLVLLVLQEVQDRLDLLGQLELQEQPVQLVLQVRQAQMLQAYQ